MDNNPRDDQQPQPMGEPARTVPGGRVPTPPRPGGEAQDIAAIERQEKIDRLRTREDELAQYDDDLPRKKHRFLRFLGWMLLIVLLTGGGAFAGWYYWLRHEPKPEPKANEQAQTTPPPAVEDAEPTNTHNSALFRLHFDYPQSWKATEAGDNKVTAVSPAMKLKTADGKTQNGQVIMTIQHKQVSLPAFKDGDALAAVESEIIDYTRPSQIQRASTYLSYLDYTGGASGGIDGIYVTGDFGYVKDQIIPQADITKADPLIAVTFRNCKDDKCAEPGDPLTLAVSAWQDEKFNKPIKAMVQSIVVE